jgi:hypothetical protein
MSRVKPKLTPSGEIEADGVLYRIVEPADSQRYSVVRESDGTVIGSFVLDDVRREPHADAVEDGALEPELVLAIARLLATPRGALPLQ